MTSLIILIAAGLLLLFLGLGKNKQYLAPVGILGLLISLGLQFSGTRQHSALLSGMMVFDSFATSFGISMVVLTLLIFLLSIEYYEAVDRNLAENYSLMLFSLVGAIVMVSYTNLVMLFLGIEVLSIPLYILAASKKKSYRSNEASFKYFILGSFASAILLFGIVLLYGTTASFELQDIKAFSLMNNQPPLFIGGVLLVFIGMAFKVAAAPFHFWSPDVYEGSPTLITAFMATVVKSAGFASLWRLMDLALIPLTESTLWMIWIMTFLTLGVGNFSALWQSSFKRLLAYSSIGNSGFMLLAVLAADAQTPQTLLFYTFTYSLASLIAFALFFTVKQASNGSEQTDIFTGLWKNHPFMAVMLTLSLFSLAGIPPLAGFFGKYLVFLQAIRQDFLWITMFAIMMALVSVYYYFSVLRFVFSGKGEQKHIKYPVPTVIVLIISGLILLILGLFPTLLL